MLSPEMQLCPFNLKQIGPDDLLAYFSLSWRLWSSLLLACVLVVIALLCIKVKFKAWKAFALAVVFVIGVILLSRNDYYLALCGCEDDSVAADAKTLLERNASNEFLISALRKRSVDQNGKFYACVIITNRIYSSPETADAKHLLEKCSLISIGGPAGFFTRGDLKKIAESVDYPASASTLIAAIHHGYTAQK